MVKIIREIKYEESVEAFSVFSMEQIEVIGEQIVIDEGEERHWVLYNKKHYTPENKKPFVSIVPNIRGFEPRLKSDDWEAEIPIEVLPLVDYVEGGGELTLGYVLKQCEFIMESAQMGGTSYGIEEEGVQDVYRYYKKYKR